ncbi:hypothetical protein [Parafrankia discariae]|uniref:hypothetical protein n=1 Tax=Parafrankia discariae TaxID=365528 RepID=UPI0003A68FD4|nr:hypothetical protein [Parafrankia discariae]
MTIDVERELRAALRAVTAEVTARPDTTRLVRERFRLRRRRRRAALAAAVAVLAVAIPTGLGLARSDSDTVEVRPARPAPTAGPPSAPTTSSPTAAPTGPAGPGSGLGHDREVGGVSVTWLPAGMVLAEDPSFGAGSSDLIPDTIAYRADYFSTSGSPRAFVDVTVTWGPAPSLDTVESRMRGAQPRRTFTRTTVRGRPALFTRMDPEQELALVWAEQGGPLLEVGGGTPTTEDELRRVAEGLDVGVRPTLDPDTERAVRETVTRAFATSGPADRALGAVEGGSALAEDRLRYLARFPGLASTLRVTVHDVALPEPEHAVATFTLTFTDPAVPLSIAGRPDGPRSYSTAAWFIHTADGWKLSRGTCTIILTVCPIGAAGAAPGGPS